MLDLRDDVLLGQSRVNDRAPETHSPTQYRAIVSRVLLVEDPDRPISDGTFIPVSEMSACIRKGALRNAPMFDAHKPPARETSVGSVAWPRCGKYTLDSVGADQLNRYITPLRMLDPNSDGDMLQGFEIAFLQGICGDGDFTGDTSGTDWLSSAHFEVGIHGTSRELNSGKVYPSLWLDEFPLLGLHNIRVSIQNAVAILVAEGTTSGSCFPVRIVGVYGPASPDGDMLDIAPRQFRSG